MIVDRRTIPRFTHSIPAGVLAGVMLFAWFAPAAMAQSPAPATPTDEVKQDDASSWMGVRIRPVPEALAAHLPLERSEERPNIGLMVVNLVKDGPADQAGLRQYDVIVSFNHEPVTDELGQFVRKIGKYQPGEKITMTIVRQGRRMPLALTLGKSEPALATNYQYKYPEQPTGVFQETAGFRGAVITRNGNDWQMQDFREADPAMFKDLPPEVRSKVMTWAGAVTPVNRTVISRGGGAIEISRDASGRITVSRSARDARGVEQVVKKTYKDAAAMKEADREAHALHEKIESDPSLTPAQPKEGEQTRTFAAPPPVVITDGADAQDDPDELTRMLNNAEMYREQIRDYEAFLEQYTEYLRGRLRDDPELENDPAVPMMWQELLNRSGRAVEPQREFKVDPTGRIDVRIRKDAGDLLISFRNEEEMAAMYPKLYEQYRALVTDDQ